MGLLEQRVQEAIRVWFEHVLPLQGPFLQSPSYWHHGWWIATHIQPGQETPLPILLAIWPYQVWVFWRRSVDPCGESWQGYFGVTTTSSPEKSPSPSSIASISSLVALALVSPSSSSHLVSPWITYTLFVMLIHYGVWVTGWSRKPQLVLCLPLMKISFG